MFRLMLDGHPDCNIFGEFELAVSQLSDEGWPTLEMYYRHLEQDRVFNSPPLLRIDRTLGYPQLVRSFFEQLKLLVHHKGVRVRDSIDRYVLPLWTAHQFRRVAPKYVTLNVRKRMNEIDKEHLK